MIRRLALWAVGLYPRAWRARYEPELLALLGECRLSPARVVDLLRGAFDAHLSPQGLTSSPPQRMRGTIVATLGCWTALALLGAGFWQATEDGAFRIAGGAHALLGDAWLLVLVLAIVGAAVIALAGAPLAYTVMLQAWQERTPALRRAIMIAVLAVGGFAVATALLALFARGSQGPSLLGHALFVLWAGLAIVVAAVCALAARACLMRARLPAAQLVLGVAGAWLLARIMAVLTIAVGLYAMLLVLESPSLAASPNGPLNLPTTMVLGSQLVGMVLASTLAAVTTRRGVAALRGG